MGAHRADSGGIVTFPYRVSNKSSDVGWWQLSAYNEGRLVARNGFAVMQVFCIRRLSETTRAAALQQTWAEASPSVRSLTMSGESMFPTLRNGEKLRINMSAYRHSTPKRGDIIVFRAVPAGQPGKLFIKRIIGLPGEVVSIHNHAVYINNRKLKEPYVDAAHRAAYVYNSLRVPKNHYFVLGDNRNNSQDSHLWGMLAKRYILGTVVVP
jgi:signal peptidase I